VKSFQNSGFAVLDDKHQVRRYAGDAREAVRKRAGSPLTD
jgi:hypothetical protein